MYPCCQGCTSVDEIGFILTPVPGPRGTPPSRCRKRTHGPITEKDARLNSTGACLLSAEPSLSPLLPGI
jgi:hypothetical protein